MKFICSVIINQPIEIVAEYFADSKYLGKYQPDFIKKELISGENGQKNAISKMYYKQGKGTMELTETVLENHLPNEFIGHYHHSHMDNTMASKFTSLSKNKTRYDAEIEYLEFRGFMPKVLAIFFPNMFKKQVQKQLDNFKKFVEGI